MIYVELGTMKWGRHRRKIDFKLQNSSQPGWLRPLVALRSPRMLAIAGVAVYLWLGNFQTEIEFQLRILFLLRAGVFSLLVWGVWRSVSGSLLLLNTAAKRSLAGGDCFQKPLVESNIRYLPALTVNRGIRAR
ncbi:hypothetical protein [Kaarinaea lacus]